MAMSQNYKNDKQFALTVYNHFNLCVFKIILWWLDFISFKNLFVLRF